MDRPDALSLVRVLNKAVKDANQSSQAVAFNHSETFVVYEVKDSFAKAQTWIVPGLFVSYDELERSHVPYITVYYKFGCGTILHLKFEKKFARKPLPHFEVMTPGCVFKDSRGVMSAGFKVPFGVWYKDHLNYDDFVKKSGLQRREHFAVKTEA
jgi:hypothetical protein